MKNLLPVSRITGRLAPLWAILLTLLAVSAARAQSFNQTGGLMYNPDGTLTLHWTGPGNLQFAPSVAGPWTTVIGSQVSYSGVATQMVSGSSGFFRLANGNRTSAILPAPTIPPLPPISSATLQLLSTPAATGNTLLQVVFQSTPGVALSPSNFFAIDDQVYLLRDDGVYPDTTAGDGNYAAIIPMDTNDMVAWNNHVDDVAAQSNLNQPVYTGRMVTGTNALSKFALVPYWNHLVIPLLPFPCSQGASDFYDWRKTLLITNLSVVADPTRTFDPCGSVGTPMGPWTFGYMMSNICNQAATGIDPRDFVMTWLRNWEFDQTVNFDLVNNRSNAIVTQVINNWLDASGKVNLANAPFRLLAIVNRIDLRSHAFPYDNAGECRFVFGVVNPSSPCSTLPFTVIFEYGVPLNGCAGIKNWANQWAALNAMPFGPAYNAALEAITDQVTLPNSDPTRPPNFSAINQIRSNDLLVFPNWDLREFVLGSTGYLIEHTVKNNPAGSFNRAPMTTTYCNDPVNIPNILADNFTVPLIYLGLPFLGGHALSNPTFWDGTPPIGSTISPPVRIHFSLNTCNGCHNGETSTAFTHVAPRLPGSPAALSGFLTGISVADPGLSGLTSTYADLARRVADMDMVVHKPCVCLSLQRPLTTPH
jgi:hypothetical protein